MKRVTKKVGGKQKNHEKSEEEMIGWLVLAIAGDWASMPMLVDMGKEFAHVTNGTAPNEKQWKRWLEGWWKEGQVELAGTAHGGYHYRLHTQDRHEALSGASRDDLRTFLNRLESRYWRGDNSLQRANLALYCDDEEALQQAISHSRSGNLWIGLVGAPPNENVFALLSENHQEEYLQIEASRVLQLESPPSSLLLNSSFPRLAAERIAIFALGGDSPSALAELAKVVPEQDKSGHLFAAMTVMELARDDIGQARTFALQALLMAKGKKKYPSLNGPLSMWVAFCAITGSPQERALAELMMSGPRRSDGNLLDQDLLILRFLSWLSTEESQATSIAASPIHRSNWNNLTMLWYHVLGAWGIASDEKNDVRAIASALKECGAIWAHAEVLALSKKTGKRKSTLAGMYTPKEPWERRLEMLAVFSSSANVNRMAQKTHSSADAEHRIIWYLKESKYYDGGLELRPMLQKHGKKGFSKGRIMTPLALRKHLNASWLGSDDRKVLNAIEQSGGRAARYEFGMQCIAALEANPNVFWEEDMSPAEVVVGSAALNVERKGESIILRPTPFATERETRASRDGARLVIYHVDQQHVDLCEVTGTEMHLPAKAEDALAQVMGTLPANIPLNTDIAPQGREVCEIVCAPHLVVQLHRSSETLRVSCMVMPLGSDGPIFSPGRGKEVVVAELGGQATQTRRDLEGEIESERTFLSRCPTLQKAEMRNGQMIVEGLGETLSVLHQLHLMGDEITCLWKEGEPMQVDLSVDLSGLQMKFGDSNSWLTADISVDVSKDISLNAHQLVQNMVPGTSQFVKLDDGRFVALSESLSAKISSLADLGQVGKKGITMGPANAYALSAWLGDLDGKAAKKGAKLAEKRLAKVRESVALVPVLPNTFAAELREYQFDGYQWLGRLAHWGGGALLCDDMGLGKTVQMLAVMANRGPLGPALVVAPVSVMPHWGNLMRQFAPTLRFHQLGATGRAETVENLAARDVLVVSYGLLHNEIDVLSKRSFQTIVLDEAQAIKNPQSRRAKAAFKLQGEFRVVTTGTPIENNLGELWSIMNFANPGLLGSSRQFSDAYGKPIQNDGDRDASRRLRKRIAPFLLRRTKAQVLIELPKKTEVTLEIEPGKEESQFYAAVRDKILADVQAGMNRPAQQRIQILAALMKLRRIACHPSLVDPAATCGSSKQDAFLELVEELREAGHRILVFSQFVGHLAIAKANLEAKKVSYQYLDGSTTRAKREKAVNAFQNGEGDVFLISLKAGGVGLHLTGADYVIHLDPWWNPAVEDQASDRAHRMGQTRPVTVYRLVTKGTVEQRVLELHSRKRQLAEDLISGNENTGALGVNDMLELMADIGTTTRLES